LVESFARTSEDLVEAESDLCAFSGSTAVAVLIHEDMLYCANCGDSRAVLGTYSNSNELGTIHLSQDHKPDREEERNRIIAKKGRIDSCRTMYGEAIGPLRVWLKKQNLPGLAMTRSFGDLVAASVGVTSDPEIITYRHQTGDQFIILASDGIWEFISSEEAVELVASANSPEEACNLLAEEATRRWKAEEDVVDDITVVVVQL